MGIIGWIIILIVATIVCRVLRSVFEAIDWIAYLLVPAAFIFVWITNGFWSGLLAGIIGCAAVSLLFGIGGGTEVRMFGNKYTLTCTKCRYDDLDIAERTDNGIITTRCKRCGHKDIFRLNP